MEDIYLPIYTHIDSWAYAGQEFIVSHCNTRDERLYFKAIENRGKYNVWEMHFPFSVQEFENQLFEQLVKKQK